MALIQLTKLSFTYEGSYDPVFTDLTCQLDTGWRLGLIGRNGRGKTTLLRLLAGELIPQGTVQMPLTPALFPFPVLDQDLTALGVLCACAPNAPEWRLRLETNGLNLPEAVLLQPYRTLSRGEQTKLMLAALFARDDTYPLIDEPTNHLDLRGRDQVADYLAKKDGFLLVSHDRAFLNRCIDHTLSINRSTVAVQRGNFDTWETELERKNSGEQARNEQIRKDITRMTESARRQAEWSRKTEQGKYHVQSSDVAVADRGYIGARSAAMMKRSLHTQARIEQNIEEKKALLRDFEPVGELKLTPLAHPKRRLLELRDVNVRYGERTVCRGITFALEQGERVALTGRNGAGKSSLLKAVCGLSDALYGYVSLAPGLVVSYVPQSSEGLCGSLRDWIAERGVDETLFKAILRNMDFGRQQFDKAVEQYSEGQKKKLLLARSLCERAHLYVWDEPLNYIDVFSRMQLEALILSAKPTLLIVEHDRAFLERVCTRTVDLDAFGG
ncbi:MAG TPA: ATP-binding cassette domain-containing protein [Candidatus Limiplasma sp.]|nr:ATP-binding cassette domain-containing protein [Candidatus Limiplasma sp.]HPS82023.1 ATP-binding cassette domain-containing protein [Candidatus Limiplasma sp.]